jgi:hypothetical protein
MSEVERNAFMSIVCLGHVAASAECLGQGLASMNGKSCGTFDCLLWD